jgi:hypothetical protein
MSENPVVLPTPDPVLDDPKNAKLKKKRRYVRRQPFIRRTKQDAKDAGPALGDQLLADMPRVDADEAGSITRMSLADRQITTFDLPRHRRKPGWDYKWEVITVMGVKVDRSVLRDSHRAGWRPEKARDWPELAEGSQPDDAIEEGGQMLMGRPIHLSNEAQVEGYNRAKQQEKDRMLAAAGGHVAGGQEGLANIRGVEVRNPSLQVELAIGSAR